MLGRGAGRSNTPIRTIPISTIGRCGHGDDRAANLCNRQDDGARSAAARVDFGLQSKNGGWASFDADNTHMYLNNIPFSDHGALRRPADSRRKRALRVNARPARREPETSPILKRGVDHLLNDEEKDGSWCACGMNYIYGTWSALCALNAAGVAIPRLPCGAPWLACFDPKRGRGPGRGWLKLQARLQRLRKISEHGVANVMGALG